MTGQAVSIAQRELNNNRQTKLASEGREGGVSNWSNTNSFVIIADTSVFCETYFVIKYRITVIKKCEENLVFSSKVKFKGKMLNPFCMITDNCSKKCH